MAGNSESSAAATRRQFPQGLGGGAAAVGATAVGTVTQKPVPADAAGPVDFTHPGRFGRIFHLPSFASPTDRVTAALLELGKPAGILDAHDDLSKGPELLITDLSLSANNPNNPDHTAGTTFMGQFLDHDMSFDTSSRLGHPTPPITAPNARTPHFDLDSVYGNGPAGSPQLYEAGDRIQLRVESGGLFEDLPRDPTTKSAILGDPRNDENVIIAGLHAAFLLAHNRAVARVRSEVPGISDDDAFFAARRIITWHYHWMILHEFLPLFVGHAMVDHILAGGRRFYLPRHDQSFIPVEFQVSYRFGHSMVRPSYRANLAGDNGEPFFAMIFDPAGEGSPDPVDLRGGAQAPRRFVGWQTFFDFGDGQVKRNKQIDTRISTPLFHLPLGVIPTGAPPTSLPQRNLLRHLTWQLPSGQALAEAMGAPVLGATDLADLRSISSSFVHSTPLWYYILKEAEVMEAGLHLGPVGGRIVAGVFNGPLQTDTDSYVTREAHFTPTLPTRTAVPEDFRMIDFLTFAGVDPATRGQ